MKKFILSLFSLCLLFSVQAQDANSAYKAAKKAKSNYDVQEDSDKKKELLSKAANQINMAMKGASAFEGKSLTKMYLLAGSIFNEVSNENVKSLVLNPEAKVDHPDASMKAFSALKEVLNVADKKYFKSDALTGLVQTAGHLSNSGLFAFKAADYEGAYKYYNAVSDLKTLLDGKGKKDVLKDPNDYNEHLYMTGLSAMQCKKSEEATTVFKQLMENDYDEPGVYNCLVQLNMESNPEEAEKYLTAGREKYPENEELMVSELNHYLQANRFDELVTKLKSAIAANPENVSYYTALANTYDNLFQKELEAKNMPAAEGHFKSALDYYGQALDKDGSNFFAMYNSGVLYVNKANVIIEELKVLENKGNFGKAALREMEAKKAAINVEFEKALPFFKKSEAINPNDINALSALKEIYARNEDFAASKEMAARIKTVQDGGENAKAYHE